MTFRCSTDPDRWPWLALDLRDPIAVQALNYYVAYETAIARGNYAPGQWTALTATEWRCNPEQFGVPVHGLALVPDDEDSDAYEASFFDADDRLVCSVAGRGVVFRNRDFEAWRQEQKLALVLPVDAGEFDYCDPQALGLANPVESFIGNILAGELPAVDALVSRTNGFPPLHPWHDGSGDHVNAAHLADAARQFARLLLRQPLLEITAGSMEFKRFVELGHPFHISLSEDGVMHSGSTILVHQFAWHCATIRLDFDVLRM